MFWCLVVCVCCVLYVLCVSLCVCGVVCCLVYVCVWGCCVLCVLCCGIVVCCVCLCVCVVVHCVCGEWCVYKEKGGSPALIPGSPDWLSKFMPYSCSFFSLSVTVLSFLLLLFCGSLFCEFWGRRFCQCPSLLEG